jgi:hypothetical protein
MQKLKLQLGGSKKGSALLITLLMLGVLMTLTLGVSALVIREIGVSQSVVDANKAFYASEAGVEMALLELSEKGTGFEPNGKFDSEEGSEIFKIDPSFAYKYETSNRTDSVPSFPDEQPIFVESATSIDNEGLQIADCKLTNARNPFALAYNKDQLYENCPRATYRKLPLNETHIIPLYSIEDGSSENVEDFLVEYYLNLKDSNSLYGSFRELKLENFDVLRWKLYGKPLTGVGAQRTESIADFYPGVTNNGPDRPVCIGTDASIRAVKDLTKAETCVFPSLSKKPPQALGQGEAPALSDVTLWSAARECYLTDAGAGVTGGALIKGTTQEDDATGCQMRDFINNHKENYLILTNMVNPNIVGISNLRDPSQLARADIYYRVLARKDTLTEETPKLVKDFAEIRSFGFASAGNVVKSLDVRYKAPGFLPVFNFSLYKTKTTDDESEE